MFFKGSKINQKCGAFHAPVVRLLSPQIFVRVVLVTVVISTAFATATAQDNQPEPLPDPGNLLKYRNRTGQTLQFRVCGSIDGNVWGGGNGIYTDDSKLSSAAVHAGVLTNGQIGLVTVQKTGAQKGFVGSSKNSVTAQNWGAFPGSFCFIPEERPVPTNAVPRYLKIKNVRTEEWLTADRKIEVGSWITSTKDKNSAITWQRIGSNDKSTFKANGTDLYLSYRELTGAAQFASSPRDADFKLTKNGQRNTWTLLNNRWQLALWMKGKFPYVSKNSDVGLAEWGFEAGAASDRYSPPVRKSVTRGQSFRASFTNNTSSSVDISWLDFNGNEKPFGRINPNATWSIDTFPGHIWIVKRQRTVVSEFVCSNGRTKYDIGTVTVKQKFRTLWLPFDGQEHLSGQKSGSISTWYITTWAAQNKKGVLSRVKTRIPQGDYVSLTQVYWKKGQGNKLGKIIVYDETNKRVIKEQVFKAEYFSSSGEYQRVAVDFNVPTPTNISISVEYFNNHYIWIGAMSLNKKRKPFFNMAHRTNSIATVNKAIADGANGIETDIHPSQVGSSMKFMCYHYGDLPAKATNVDGFAAYLTNLKRQFDNGKLALAMIDCKQTYCKAIGLPPAGVPDVNAYARNLAAAIKKSGIPSDRIVLSIPLEKAASFNRAVKSAGLNCPIDSYLESYPFTNDNEKDVAGINRWVQSVQSTGASFAGVGKDQAVRGEWFRWAYWVAGLIKERDQGNTFSKVWFWTVNTEYGIRQCLDFALDGVLTDYPNVTQKLLNSSPYNRMYRKADVNDPLDQVFGRN